MDETKSALEDKLGLTTEQTAHLFRELGIHFADAWVKTYESFIPAMANDSKDRHVLAAAVVSGAQTIVTSNLKHFPLDALAPWNIEVQRPDEFLIHQYHLSLNLSPSSASTLDNARFTKRGPPQYMTGSLPRLFSNNSRFKVARRSPMCDILQLSLQHLRIATDMQLPLT
jgi:hypothetical protein